ncbi:MAG: hypothetical protein CVU50_10035 [Candidatus Cloacimonetes bacterium HGW-Cloacimonetes-3]|jgi:PAS domain S-box-containing protein|nr:MAG: hypothetical protein CVU50_10035 [Candidatus Cloacimonetes bacterium HGW-Cloacimonetes-3]
MQFIHNASHDSAKPPPRAKDKHAYDIIKQLILEETSYGYWEWKEYQPFNFLSPTLIQALGYTEAELTRDSIDWRKLVHPDDLPAVEELNQTLLTTTDMDSFRMELRYLGKNNATVWMLSKAVVLKRNVHGFPISIIGCNIDITEGKQMQLYSARQAELAQISLAVNQPFELQHLLLQIAQVTETFLPSTGGASIVLWNKQTLQYAVSASTVPGQGLSTTKDRVRTEHGATRWIIDNKQPIIMNNIAEDPFTANPMLPEFGLHAYAGIPLLYEDEILGVLYALDNSIHYYTPQDLDFLQELASRASLAIIKVRMYEELNTSYQELQTFTQSVSHDLRAPMRIIDGFSAILQEDHAAALNDDAQSCIRRIRTASKRMDDLIKDIMSLSKVSRQSMHFEDVDLTDIASGIFNDLAATCPNRNTQVTIETDLRLNGDSKLITILMENLLSNAWKFTSHKELAQIYVGKTIIDEQPYFYVKDNGVGFDMNQDGELFKEFSRLSNAADFEGTGIGLSIVKRIISRHNGEVFAKSMPNEGTTFYFRTSA